MNDEELLRQYYRWLNQVEIDLNYFYAQFDQIEGKRDIYRTLNPVAQKVRKARSYAAAQVGRNQQSPGLKIEDEL